MLNFYLLLNSPIWLVRLQMFVIGQFGAETANEGFQQPIMFERFVNYAIKGLNHTRWKNIILHENFWLLILLAGVAVCLFRVPIIASLCNRRAGTLRTAE